jgi:SAM-dependent methyltransferase
MGEIASRYLDSIVDQEYTSEVGYRLRVKPFLENMLKTPRRVLVVGVSLGGAEELDGLHHYRPDLSVCGVDLSIQAISRRQENIKNETLILADLAQLPFCDCSFDGILCSAVMHEVYSYSRNGNKNLLAALACMEHSLSEDGLLLIREFHVPHARRLIVEPITEESSKFAVRFISSFRKDLEPTFVEKYEIVGPRISANARSIYELLVHFRMAKRHFCNMEDFFTSKEMEERYFVYSVEEYRQAIENTALQLRQIFHNRFERYYSTIGENFIVREESGENHSLVLGFDDLYMIKEGTV